MFVVLRLAEKLRSRLVSLPRRQKRLIQVAMDVVLVWAALWLAFVVRLGEASSIEPLGGHAWLFVLAPLISIPLFILAWVRGLMPRLLIHSISSFIS